MKHLHPEIEHPEARRLLAIEFLKWRTFVNTSGIGTRYDRWRYFLSNRFGIISMARQVDKYLRGVGRVF